jgi:hypothetical protein
MTDGPFLVNYVLEKFLKRLVGRTDVEDALLRLDSLTKEENLMAMAKNLEITQHVEHNVKEIKVLAESTEDRVQVIDQTVKVVEERMQSSISLFARRIY